MAERGSKVETGRGVESSRMGAEERRVERRRRYGCIQLEETCSKAPADHEHPSQPTNPFHYLRSPAPFTHMATVTGEPLPSSDCS